MNPTQQNMQFDPTHNYGSENLEIAENLIRWKFAELLKNLITLSSKAQRQTEIIGIGVACDEMVEDFNTYFTLSYNSYVENYLLTHAQHLKLLELEMFFIERSAYKSLDFWDDFLLSTNPEWEIVRQKAKEILNMLDFKDLTVDLFREEKYENTGNGNQISIQSTQLRLVRIVEQF